MTTRLAVLVAGSITLLWSCAPGVDLDAERAALLQADKDWAAAAIEANDIDRIVSFWTDDAQVYAPGDPILDGKEAIRAMVAGSMEIPGFSIQWEPVEVVIAPGGEMGYTTGKTTFTAPGDDGQLVTSHARYLTVWRKESDGQWRCVVDMWNAAPSEE